LTVLVGHDYDGKDEVDEEVRAEEDDEYEIRSEQRTVSVEDLRGHSSQRT